MLGFRVSGLGFRDLGFEFRGLGPLSEVFQEIWDEELALRV